MQTPWLDLDLHRLELRFAAARLVEPRAVERIARSIAVGGQIVPCIAVAEAPAPAADLGAARCGSRGGAHGAAVGLGGGACDRAVGARQCRTCKTPFAGPR